MNWQDVEESAWGEGGRCRFVAGTVRCSRENPAKRLSPQDHSSCMILDMLQWSVHGLRNATAALNKAIDVIHGPPRPLSVDSLLKTLHHLV